MSDLAFILTVLAIGLGWWIIIQRMRKNYRDRHPNSRNNPLDRWYRGESEDDEDDEEDEENRRR